MLRRPLLRPGTLRLDLGGELPKVGQEAGLPIRGNVGMEGDGRIGPRSAGAFNRASVTSSLRSLYAGGSRRSRVFAKRTGPGRSATQASAAGVAATQCRR